MAYMFFYTTETYENNAVKAVNFIKSIKFGRLRESCKTKGGRSNNGNNSNTTAQKIVSAYYKRIEYKDEATKKLFEPALANEL